MNKPVSIDDSNFDQMVLQAAKPVVVDLWAAWCIDQNPRTATKYSIMSIPTLLIFKNGEPVSQIVGVRPKGELKQSLEAVLD